MYRTVEGRQVELRCESKGGKPAAEVKEIHFWVIVVGVGCGDGNGVVVAVDGAAAADGVGHGVVVFLPLQGHYWRDFKTLHRVKTLHNFWRLNIAFGNFLIYFGQNMWHWINFHCCEWPKY